MDGSTGQTAPAPEVPAMSSCSPRPLARFVATLAASLGLVVMSALSGCAHAPPVAPWQRANLVRRALQFDDGLEGRFRQHMFSAREGAEGGYGHVGGGCGCN